MKIRTKYIQYQSIITITLLYSTINGKFLHKKIALHSVYTENSAIFILVQPIQLFSIKVLMERPAPATAPVTKLAVPTDAAATAAVVVPPTAAAATAPAAPAAAPITPAATPAVAALSATTPTTTTAARATFLHLF